MLEPPPIVSHGPVYGRKFRCFSSMIGDSYFTIKVCLASSSYRISDTLRLPI